MNDTREIFYSVCNDLSDNFMPQFLFRLRRDNKQEILCLIALPNTSKFVKNTPLLSSEAWKHGYRQSFVFDVLDNLHA